MGIELRTYYKADKRSVTPVHYQKFVQSKRNIVEFLLKYIYKNLSKSYQKILVVLKQYLVYILQVSFEASTRPFE